MKQQRKSISVLDSKAKAFAYCDQVLPLMEQLRNAVDELEPMIDDELWTIVKYREILFMK